MRWGDDADEIVGPLPLRAQAVQVRCNFFPKSLAGVVKVSNLRCQLVEPRDGSRDRFRRRSLTKIASWSCHGSRVPAHVVDAGFKRDATSFRHRRKTRIDVVQSLKPS
jgi:hypothetical protein